MNKYVYLFLYFFFFSKITFAMEQVLLFPTEEQEKLYWEFDNRADLKVLAFQSLTIEEQQFLQRIPYSKFPSEIKKAIKKFVLRYFIIGMNKNLINPMPFKELSQKIAQTSYILLLLKQRMSLDEPIEVRSELTARLKALQDLKKINKNFNKNLIDVWAILTVEYLVNSNLIENNSEAINQKILELSNSTKNEFNLLYKNSKK